jgi:hypothetical protein
LKLQQSHKVFVTLRCKANGNYMAIENTNASINVEYSKT